MPGVRIRKPELTRIAARGAQRCERSSDMHVHTLTSLMAASALLAFAVGEVTAAEKRGTLQGQKVAPAAGRAAGPAVPGTVTMGA